MQPPLPKTRHPYHLFISALILTFIFLTSSIPSPTLASTPRKIFLPFIAIQNDPPPQSACCGIPYQTGSSPTIEAQTLQAINAERTSRGLAPLASQDALVQVARFHSRDMAINKFTDHSGSAGESWLDRFSWTHLAWTAMAENLGFGFSGNPSQVVAAWMNSPDHRANILNPTYNLAGVGYYRDSSSPYGYYWTVDFGKLQ